MPVAIIASTARSAIPVAASPAPWNSNVCSPSLPPVIRNADSNPASTTAAVPWMSSLKVGILLEQPERIGGRKVLELNHHAREELACGNHELYDQSIVFLAAHTALV